MSGDKRNAPDELDDQQLYKKMKIEAISDSLDQMVEDNIDSFLYGVDENEEPTDKNQAHFEEDYIYQETEQDTSNDTLASLGLPTSFDQFLLYIYKLDPLTLKTAIADYQAMFKNIRRQLIFSNSESYKATYLPLILYQLAAFIDASLHDNQGKPSYTYSVLIKSSSSNDKELEMTCVKLRNPHDPPAPQFGDLIVIQSVHKPDLEEDEEIRSPDLHLGLVTDHEVRLINPDIRSEVNLFNHYPSSAKSRLIADEITFKMKFVSALYFQTNFQLEIKGLSGIQNIITQAKLLYNIDSYLIGQEMIQPKIHLKPSGVCLKLNEKKFNPNQLDMLQKSVDLLGQSSPESSNILSINCCSIFAFYLILPELVRQSQYCKDQISQGKVEEEKSCLLFISKNVQTLDKLYSELSRELHGLNILLLSNKHESKKIKDDCCKSYFSILNDPEFKGKNTCHNVVQECIDYFKGHLSLEKISAPAYIEQYHACEKARCNLFYNASLILSTLDWVSSDTQFIITFRKKNHSRSKIMCAIIDEATTLSEPELLSLQAFNIAKYILVGNNSSYVYEEPFSSNHLKRSFFSRHLLLSSQNKTGSAVAVLQN